MPPREGCRLPLNEGLLPANRLGNGLVVIAFARIGRAQTEANLRDIGLGCDDSITRHDHSGADAGGSHVARGAGCCPVGQGPRRNLFVRRRNQREGWGQERSNSKGLLDLGCQRSLCADHHRSRPSQDCLRQSHHCYPEEAIAIVGGTLAHFGTFSVIDKNLNFKIESATFPNWDGAEQERAFTLNGDELKYSLGAASAG